MVPPDSRHVGQLKVLVTRSFNCETWESKVVSSVFGFRWRLKRCQQKKCLNRKHLFCVRSVTFKQLFFFSTYAPSYNSTKKNKLFRDSRLSFRYKKTNPWPVTYVWRSSSTVVSIFWDLVGGKLWLRLLDCTSDECSKFFSSEKKKKKNEKATLWISSRRHICYYFSVYLCVCVRDRMIIIIKDMNKQPFYPGSQGKKKYHTITPKTEKENI